MTKKEAGQLVDKMLGCYPSLNVHDPETYVATVTALLCGFSSWVGELAIDRISKTSKFVPSVAEINEALEHFQPSFDWAEEWDRKARAQLEERARMDAIPALEDRTSRARIEAGFAELLECLRPKAKDPLTVAQVKEKFDISDAQWDAIPNQPRDVGYWRGIRPPAAALGLERER